MAIDEPPLTFEEALRDDDTEAVMALLHNMTHQQRLKRFHHLADDGSANTTKAVLAVQEWREHTMPLYIRGNGLVAAVEVATQDPRTNIKLGALADLVGSFTSFPSATLTPLIQSVDSSSFKNSKHAVTAERVLMLMVNANRDELLKLCIASKWINEKMAHSLLETGFCLVASKMNFSTFSLLRPLLSDPAAWENIWELACKKAQPEIIVDMALCHPTLATWEYIKSQDRVDVLEECCKHFNSLPWSSTELAELEELVSTFSEHPDRPNIKSVASRHHIQDALKTSTPVTHFPSPAKKM